MHKNLKKYKQKWAVHVCNLELVKEQINEALSNFTKLSTKATYKLGVKNPVFRDAKHNYR